MCATAPTSPSSLSTIAVTHANPVMARAIIRADETRGNSNENNDSRFARACGTRDALHKHAARMLSVGHLNGSVQHSNGRGGLRCRLNISHFSLPRRDRNTAQSRIDNSDRDSAIRNARTATRRSNGKKRFAVVAEKFFSRRALQRFSAATDGGKKAAAKLITSKQASAARARKATSGLTRVAAHRKQFRPIT